MSNMHDYLLWRGDLQFDSINKFNELDSVILARFSYLVFNKIDMKEKETIKTIYEKMNCLDNDEFTYDGDKKLITFLGQSERFKNLVVTDYVRNNDKEIETQFTAITIHLPNDELYISYIGTDSTIFGWKEDFNMAFMENVPCQADGKKYLERIAKKYPNKKLRIGGHSKGGNVAIYSGISVSDDIKDRIIKIYNYDGPGFHKSIISKYGNKSIISKIETYIPQDSIVGRLLNHKEKITIVYSLGKGLLQHDIYSWQVLKDDFIQLGENTNISENMDKTLTDWLEVTTSEQRKIVIDAIFELLYSTDTNTFGEMSKNFSRNLPKILKKYGELANEDKTIIMEMIKKVVSIYINIYKTKEKEKLEAIKQEYTNKSKLKFDEWNKIIKTIKQKNA